MGFMRILILGLLSFASFAAQSITFPNSSIFVSPGACTTSGGIMTCYPDMGWYMKFKVTGTTSIKLTLDTTANNGSTANAMPSIKTVATTASAADSAYTLTQFPANNTSGTQVTAISGLTSGTLYTITIYGLQADGRGACWTTSICNSVIQSMQIDDAATLSAATIRPKRCIFFGDSYLQSTFGGSTGAIPTFVDFTWGWPYFLSAAIGCEFTQVGVGSQGWVRSGNGGFPALGSSWNFLQSGTSRTFGTIDFAFFAEGLNDHGLSGANITSNVSATITAARSTLGSGTRIFLVPPINPLPLGGDGSSGSVTADIQAGVTAAADTQTFMVTVPAEFANVAFTSGGGGTWCAALDGLHLNGGSQGLLDGNCQGLIGYSVAMKVQSVISSAGLTGGATLSGAASLH